MYAHLTDPVLSYLIRVDLEVGGGGGPADLHSPGWWIALGRWRTDWSAGSRRGGELDAALRYPWSCILAAIRAVLRASLGDAADDLHPG